MGGRIVLARKFFFLLDISWAITAESPPLNMVSTAGLELGTFGFRAQVANH